MVSKREEVEKWRARIALAKELRADAEKEWLLNLDYFRSKFKLDVTLGEVFVNYVWSTLKVMVPAIYNKAPEILVFPTRTETVNSAKILQEAVRLYFKMVNAKKISKRVVLDSLLFGIGWGKVGYLARTEEQPKRGFKAFGELFQAETEGEEEITVERPEFIRVSPFQLLLDPFVKCIDDCGWMIHQVPRKLSDVKNDKRYHNTERLQATGIVLSDNLRRYPRSLSSFSVEAKADAEMITLNEIWDVETGRLLVLPESTHGGGNTDFIRDIELPIVFSEGSPFPFIPLVFNEDPEQLYPISEIRAWLPQQFEINEVRTQMLNHLRRFKRVYLSDRSNSKEDLEAIERAPDGGIVQVNELDKIKPLDDAPSPGEIYPSQQIIRDDLHIVSGLGDAQRQISTKTKTATEAVIMESQSRLRGGERVDIIDEFHKELAVKLVQIIAQFVPKPLMVRMSSAKALSFGMLTSADLESVSTDYDIDIRAGSSLPVNKEVLRKQLMDLYLMMKGDPSIDSRPLLAEILKTYDFQYMVDVFNPPPDYTNMQLPSRQAGGPDRQALIRQLAGGPPGMPSEKRPGTKLGGLVSLPPMEQ